MWQEYPDRKWIAVRYPFAIGKDDYTKRLLFYVEHPMGEAAPYNDEPEYSICTDKAKSLGYRFTELKEWIYELLDYYIQVAEDIDKI